MAVQAQYPSNILLLNNRNVQEGKSPLVGGDYALKQQQSGGGGGGGDCFFLDHTNIMPVHHNHNNTAAAAAENNNNSRKRARDYTITAVAAAATSTAAPLQSSDSPLTSMQRPNFIDLTQLNNNNTQQKLTPTNRNMVSTGLGLAFGDQHQQLPRQQHHQKTSISPQSSAQSSVLLSLLSDELGSHIKQQRQEIEHFLLAQGEELRRTLAEKRQRHFRTILTAAEESLARRLREREAEVEKAARRNAELEVKASQLSLEAQAWQARARMQENYAATLQMQLQQAIISGTGAGVGMAGGHGQGGGAQLQDACDEWEGGNSTAVMGGGEAEDAESAYIDPDRVVVVSQPSCKACRNRVASVVLLPCRHMCLCTECDAVAQACPVCLSLRCSSIEVFFS